MTPARSAPAGGAGPARIALAATPIMLGLAQAWLFWPGIMIWDSIRQYRQALSGRYDDWHPPAMNWLWRQLLVFGPGPGAMLAVQLLLYWGGIALLCDAMARSGRPRSAAACIAVALLPVPALLMGVVIKDSLMAAGLVMATALLLRRPLSARLAAALALPLLIATATLRFNAVPACLPLAIAALPDRWRARRRAAAGIAAAAALAAALPIAGRALDAAPSGVGKSLMIYDLGGITRFTGREMFPAVGVADPVAVNARCYSPVAWDPYAWWGADPCAIGFANVAPALDRQAGGAARAWLGAMLGHPLAYATHRLAHFNSEERLFVRDRDLPGLPVATDPNPWSFRLEIAPVLQAIGAAALAMPIGWPVCWLAFGVALIVAGRGVPWPPLGLPLVASALLYELSYLPLGVASEIRYHLWPMTALGLAAILIAGVPGGRRRLLLALVPAAAMAVLGFAGRAAIG